MSDLDPLTGLPALPEGQFWRVERYSLDKSGWYGPYIYFSNSAAEFTHILKLMEPGIERVVLHQPARWWWSKKRRRQTVWEEKLGDKTIASEYIGISVQIPYPEVPNKSTAASRAAMARHDAAVAQQLEKLGDAAVSSLISTHWENRTDDITVVRDVTVNEASILRAANSILESIEEKKRVAAENEEQKRKAAIEAEEREKRLNYFVGDYPPRILLHD